MNQSQIVIEEGQDQVNLFGVQLEEPMSNNVGKLLHLKKIGPNTDAFSSYSALG